MVTFRLLALLVLLAAACALPASARNRPDAAADPPAPAGPVGAPVQAGEPSPPPTTRFAPLDTPPFIPAARASLTADEVVIGLARRGQHRAYPTRMLWFHHIVNDVVAPPGGEWRVPLLVTY